MLAVQRTRGEAGKPKNNFYGSGNSLSISRGVADHPLTGSDPEMIALHEDVLQRYLMKLDRKNILNRARLQIMEQLSSGRVTEDDTARERNRAA